MGGVEGHLGAPSASLSEQAFTEHLAPESSLDKSSVWDAVF